MNLRDVRDRSLHFLLRGLPIDACSGAGARLAPALGRRANPKADARARRLLTRLRPDLASDPKALDATVGRLWENIGRTFAEFAVGHRMLRSGRVSIDREDRLDDALRSGRPIVAIFPHLGNWELSEMQLGFKARGRVAVIVAPPKNTTRADIAQRVRSKVPAELLVNSRMVWRRGLAKLREPGGILMVASDENSAGQVWGPSLGRPLQVNGNAGKAVRLALSTEALVLPFHSERIEGAHLSTRYLPVIELEGDPRDAAAILEGVRRIDDVMTPPTLRLLDQWYMALFFQDNRKVQPSLRAAE